MSFENERYVSSRVDRIEALEQEIARLKRQLEAKDKEIKYHKEWALDFQKQLKEAVEAIEYLYPNIDKMFKDIPEGLSPMVYHTLSYEGDMKVRERLDNIANFLAKYRGNRE